jgi:hypothetical protein
MIRAGVVQAPVAVLARWTTPGMCVQFRSESLSAEPGEALGRADESRAAGDQSVHAEVAADYCADSPGQYRAWRGRTRMRQSSSGDD